MKSFMTSSLRHAAVWLLAALACAAPLRATERKPNFIFVIADDHRWDAMGAVQKEHGEKAELGKQMKAVNFHW